MASISPEMGLDLKLSATRSVSGFIREASAIEDGDARLAKVEEYLRILEEEKRKIEAFRRELPLSMILVSDVIGGLKEELEQWRGDRYACPVVEEFMPIKRSRLEDEGGMKVEIDCKDKMNWMSSVQLWSDNYCQNEEISCKKNSLERMEAQSEKENQSLEPKSRAAGGAFIPFKGSSMAKKEEKPAGPLPDLSLIPPSIKSSRPVVASAEDHPYGVSSGSKSVVAGRAHMSPPTSASLSLQAQQQPPRKARRCWSPELHRRFVIALQQLGGAQVATPKQIRELMKVDGLTNDEVKSHLQKYRLHTRKAPNCVSQANRSVMVMGGGLWVSQEHFTAASSQQSASPSGSPQSPLQLTGASRAVSLTAGDSYEEEDGKSESYSWK
ncbi:transcription factor NIGTH1-like [Dioscorea cayenensis subsp. rotundata]|uniref:Transcription factor NIGTH1-like n=1 Tax=Dioscorea cayennensis subsp. rotundata TaxID=55577 RepID=A0AB40CMI5_DIOCR|nr:transcription factor NIGTH1-like [Dioscorea cayenensis subsp. rotundata]